MKKLTRIIHLFLLLYFLYFKSYFINLSAVDITFSPSINNLVSESIVLDLIMFKGKNVALPILLFFK